LTGSRQLQDHSPLSAEDLRYVLDLYDEEILASDQQFGKLIDLLKEQDLYDNTLIVVLSDHGEEFNDHGSYGHGGRLWEELIRVPLLIKLPGAEFAGTRVTERVRVMDILPTVAAVLSPEFDVQRQVGVDLTGLWKQPSAWASLPILAEEEPDLRALIREGWKIIQERHSNGDPDRLWLFDLNQDPGEQKDVRGEMPDQAKTMLTHLLGTLREYQEQGVAPEGGSMELDLTPENLEALKILGYIDEPK
jgi:arylsulfatase A-like enzyme